MSKELYFDINREDAGGSLYRIIAPDGSVHFYYNHSSYNPRTDEIQVFETTYISFEAFWAVLTRDKEWFYQHPLFVHPEQRAFIREQLKTVNWNSKADKKWQESHQRQWKKVLEDPAGYYRGTDSQ